MLHFLTQRAGDIVVLQCTGRMVAGEGLKSLQRVAIAQRAAGLIVDLRGVETLDAAGLGTLLRVRQWCEAQGMSLKLSNPNKQVREVLSLTALDSVIQLQAAESAGQVDVLPREWACAES
ncbi:MAG: STAS domain-containing protein [Chlamydiota bacterium]